MARKRRKIIKLTRKLPKVYQCPGCGTQSVRITRDPLKAEDQPKHIPGQAIRKLFDINIHCGNCNIGNDYPASFKESIDIYNSFVDWFMKDPNQVTESSEEQ